LYYVIIVFPFSPSNKIQTYKYAIKPVKGKDLPLHAMEAPGGEEV
jgi:hypothetical protein